MAKRVFIASRGFARLTSQLSYRASVVAVLILVVFTSVYSITRAGVPVAQAATPATLNFQARLMSSAGNLVPDGDYNIEFKLYNDDNSTGSSQGSCTGDANCLWTETRTSSKVQVKNGYMSAYLGDTTPLPTNIWDQQLWLTMNIGGTGIAVWDGEMTPRIRLTSVPYAFRAAVANSADTLSKNTGSFTGTVDFNTLTADRRYLFPDTSLATTASPGTICVYNGAASNCPAASGSAYYIQNDTVLQTQSNYNLQGRDSGTDGTIVGILRGAAAGQTVDLLQFQATDGSVLAAVTATGNLQVASSVDTRSAGTLSVGTSTATAVSIGKSGAATTVNGALTVAEAFTANGGATITGVTDINTTGTAVTTIGNSGAGITLDGVVTVNEAATFNSSVTVAAGQYISLVGGATNTRPASPTEGMVYFDTTTKQLLVYANGKWQADRSTATKIIAPSDASDAVKASADVVLTGTADQTLINSTLVSAAGGKVYLVEGTYTLTGPIAIPNNTTLVGSGPSTVIQLDIGSGSGNAITNLDTTTGAGVSVKDLTIDGSLGTGGTQHGIYFDGLSDTGFGSDINNVVMSGWANGSAIFLDNDSYLNKVNQNLITGNITLATGSSINSAVENTVTGDVSASGNSGILAFSDNIVTGNISFDNTTVYSFIANSIFGSTSVVNGTSVVNFDANTFLGNVSIDTAIVNNISGNFLSGLSLDTVSGVTVNGNTINRSGVDGISLIDADNIRITSNRIYDNGGSGYGISIDSTSSGNYLADNDLGGLGLNDLGTDTVYGGQTDNLNNYLIQPASGSSIELAANANVTGNLTVTGDGTFTGGDITVATTTVTDDRIKVTVAAGGVARFDGTITIADLTAARTWTLPDEDGEVCLDSGNCGFVAGSADDFIQNQNAGAQATSNYWISGTGRSDTSFLAPTFDIATAATLNIGTANATAISIGDTGVATTINGSLTVTQDFSVTSAGSVAFQRNTTDITTTGTLDDLSLGTGALFRLNGASAQTITSIGSPADGRIVTLINAAATALTIQNDSGGTATNRIITGTGGNIFVPTGATVQLAYDSAASRWRIIGGTAVEGGAANQQLSNLSGTVAINQALNPNADNTLDLGSSALSWKSLYADTSVLTPRVDVSAAGTLEIGVTTATAITLGKAGVMTTAAGGLTVTSGGNVAFQRNATDITAVGTQTDLALPGGGAGALFRFNGASALTINSLAGGSDGRIITLMNASAFDVTLANETGATAANRIITGTGGSVVVPAGASITLAYDSGSSRWRVIGSTAAAGGYIQLQSSSPGNVQTGNFNISGTGIAATSLQTPLLDTATAAALNIGTTNATAINLNKNTTVAAGQSFTANGTALFKNSADSGTAFQIQNTSSDILFNADTSNSRISIGNATGSDAKLHIEGSVGGSVWTARSATASNWLSVTYGNGQYVAVGGSGNRVMTSPDGITWTDHSAAGDDDSWISVTYGNGLFVAVAYLGTDRVMTSPDGITWTTRSAAGNDDFWNSVTYGNGQFVAIGSSGDRVMTSPDGITWTARSAAGDNDSWASVTYGNGQFVAVSNSGDRVMTSPDGITWTARSAAGNNDNWISVTYGNGQFVAISFSGDRVMTSQGGIALRANGTAEINGDLQVSGVATFNGILQANSGITTANGAALVIQGGAAVTSNANGAAVTISGGAGNGTGTQGLVNLSTTAFTSSAVQTYSITGVNNISAGLVDQYSTIPVNTTVAGVIVSVPDPAQNTVIGRVLYISARDNALDFTLRLNAAGTPIDIAMKENSTATLIWNGDEWTAAGASSSTDLQSAYNNTLTSAGGAEIILNPSGGAADGFTIRNNATTPISGGVLEVQSSIGTNLFSVNNFGTELATNGGAETQGASSTTFPASTWEAAPAGGAISRTLTAGQFVTGQAGVQVITSGANHGVRNNLSSNPVVSTTYQVSFTAKLSSGSFSTLDVRYSRDGGTDLEPCTSYSTQTLVTSEWTKITCTITTDATTATNPDLIIRQTDGTGRTFWVDNLSFMRNDSTTQPSNVQIGGGINGGPITLFTLDRSTAPPVAAGDTTYYGSMYYDTTTGSIQCYEADGWGACGSPPDNIITLTPEYTGAVLNGNGIGVMTADFCGYEGDGIGALKVNAGIGALCDTTGEARNYYRWTSPQASLQEYSIYVNYKLPSTFKEFANNNTMRLTAYRDDADDADALVQMTTYRKNVSGNVITQCGTTTDITNTIDDWEETPMSGNENSCGYVGGDYIVFKITMKSRNNTNVYVENLDFTFNNR